MNEAPHPWGQGRAEPGQTSILAVLALVFGVATWVFLPLASALVAVVLGHLGRAEIRRHPGMDGDGMALAGLLLGWLQLALVVLVLASILGFLVLIGV